jgi:hypothetical protein
MPLLGALWIVAVLTGTGLMLKYSEAPATTVSPPSQWPDGTGIHRQPEQPVLVMFVHPHCPCSSASIGELERIVARCPAAAEVHVVFLHPEGMPLSWVQSDLWRKASAIPGVKVTQDDAGEESIRFHCATSGETLLYDANGVLAFHGGITASRGHAGDNPGSDAVLALLRQERAGQLTTPVFGCALRSEGECTGSSSACKR